MRCLLFIIGLVGIVFCFTGCKHKPETVVPKTPNDTTTPPPITVKCSADTVYFQNDVLPLLVSSCAKSGCHDATTAAGDVIITDYQNIITTGGVVPGNPDGSHMYLHLVATEPSDRMPPPPASPLTTTQIQSIRTWILQGALNNKCDSSGCDTVNVTYTAVISQITSTYCVGCHSGTNPSGGYDLSTYAGVKAAVASGRLMGSIRHDAGYSAMPKFGNKLSDCMIKQFQLWINAGYPQ